MILRTVHMLLGYYPTLVFFGAFGLALNLLCFVCGGLPSTDRTERFFQRLIHRHFALFIWWVKITRLIRVRFHGLERLSYGRPGFVFVANHPALIDITCLLARVPEAICIFKPAIRRNPVLGAAARRAGYLASDGGFDVVRQAANKVAAGHNLVVFPEGTRTPVGETLLPFKPGFVLIARRAGAPLQLVRVTCNHPVLGKDRPWWKLPPLAPTVDVTIGPRLEVAAEANANAAAVEIENWYRATPEAAACHVWSPALRLSDRPASAP